jgi:hypothetical protein
MGGAEEFSAPVAGGDQIGLARPDRPDPKGFSPIQDLGS